MARAHIFNAGPAALPEPVLQRAQSELLEFDNQGMSVMEMSHRSKPFAAIHAAAVANVRELMNVPDEYAVLFLQGGASHQFAMIPCNFTLEGRKAAYINSGSWAKKAIAEIKTCCPERCDVIWDGKGENYMRMPRPDEYQLDPDAAYLHICSNETIGGVRFVDFPQTGEVPLLADMSSDIMSRVVDVSKFGMIYAGAQKNLGPSGMALVILRKDLAERVGDCQPLFWRYSTHIAEDSLYNTPNTWGIYLLKLVTDWLKEQGGIPAIQKVNERKAALLYDLFDSSDYWRCPTDPSSRSIMNVVWRLPSEELENKLIGEATKAGLVGLKGHRSVGGLRASIYNAVPLQAVQDLVNFMKDFQKNNG